MKLLYILGFTVCMVSFAYTQDANWQPFTREIVISEDDSLIRANILILKTEVKIKDNLFYHWHNKGQININMGGFSGDLLDGDYLVFNTNKKMITKGQFNSGLKEGTWKYWYDNGILRKVENWNKGRLNGQSTSYANDGTVVKYVNYKAGQEASETNKLRFSLSSKLKEPKDTTEVINSVEQQ